jgi:hypothetical protein
MEKYYQVHRWERLIIFDKRRLKFFVRKKSSEAKFQQRVLQTTKD